MPAVVRYHNIKAPLGHRFDDQSLVPEGEGWVDSPRKITRLSAEESQDLAAVKRQLDTVIQRYSALAAALEEWLTAPKEEKGTAEDRLREVAAKFVTIVDVGHVSDAPSEPPGGSPLPQDHPNVDAFMKAYVIAGGLKRDTYDGNEKDRDKLLQLGVQQYIAGKHSEQVDGRFSLEKTLELARSLDESAAAQELSVEEAI